MQSTLTTEAILLNGRNFLSKNYLNVSKQSTIFTNQAHSLTNDMLLKRHFRYIVSVRTNKFEKLKGIFKQQKKWSFFKYTFCNASIFRNKLLEKCVFKISNYIFAKSWLMVEFFHSHKIFIKQQKSKNGSLLDKIVKCKTKVWDLEKTVTLFLRVYLVRKKYDAESRYLCHHLNFSIRKCLFLLP